MMSASASAMPTMSPAAVASANSPVSSASRSTRSFASSAGMAASGSTARGAPKAAWNSATLAIAADSRGASDSRALPPSAGRTSAGGSGTGVPVSCAAMPTTMPQQPQATGGNHRPAARRRYRDDATLSGYGVSAVRPATSLDRVPAGARAHPADRDRDADQAGGQRADGHAADHDVPARAGVSRHHRAQHQVLLAQAHRRAVRVHQRRHHGGRT